MPRIILIWVHEWFSQSGSVLVGGVQTYIQELVALFRSGGYRPLLITRASSDRHGEVAEGLQEDDIVNLSPSAWDSGVLPKSVTSTFPVSERDVINIIANVHAMPKIHRGIVVGIQHGIYWDRASTRLRVAPIGFNRLFNAIRAQRGYGAIEQCHHLVCVDYIYPNAAAATFGGHAWGKMSVIPNFAPDTTAVAPSPIRQFRRIVFSRRFDQYRGTAIFASALGLIRDSIRHLQVCLYGEGPDREKLTETIGTWENVSISRLEASRRLDAFDDETIAVVPSVCSEGTSLSVIEAMSKGSLIIATPIGGITNVIIDGHNGLLVKPNAPAIANAIVGVLSDPNQYLRVQRNAMEIARTSFSISLWRHRWMTLLQEIDRDIRE